MEEMAQMTVEETGMGKVRDKIRRIYFQLKGIFWSRGLGSRSFTGDNGLALVELSPFRSNKV